MRVKAWTGGSAPAGLLEISREERELVSYLFQEQMTTWNQGWGGWPDKDTRRIFWNRARYDAHSTFRPSSPGWDVPYVSR